MGKLFRQLTQTATDVDLVEGNYLGVDTPNITKKVPANLIAKQSALKTTNDNVTALTTYAQNVAHSIAPEFDSENPYKAGESVTYTDGMKYTFYVDHYGPWNDDDVVAVPVESSLEELANAVRITLEPGYYNLIGTSIGSKQTNDGYKCAKIDACVGQIFYVHGVGSSSARLWATFDEDGAIVRRADANVDAVTNPFELTIEDGEVGVAFNTLVSSHPANMYKRYFAIKKLADNMQVLVKEDKAIKKAGEDTAEIVAAISELVIYGEHTAEAQAFQLGKTNATQIPGISSSTNRCVTSNLLEALPNSVCHFDCGADYEWCVYSTSSPTSAQDVQAGSFTASGLEVQVKNRYFRVMVRASASHSGGQGSDLSSSDATALSACTFVYEKYAEKYEAKAPENSSSRLDKIAANGCNNLRGTFYYYHMMTSGNKVIFPAQSKYDFEAARRLGFKYIEANILTVADGYIMHHGQTRKTFANNHITDLNGDYANGIDVSGMTVAYIQANYRYKSSEPRMRIPPTEFLDGLQDMKLSGLRPMISFNAPDAAAFRPLVKKIFADDYIAYDGSKETDNCMIMIVSRLSSKDDIVNFAKAQGFPYLHYPNSDIMHDWLNSVASEYAGTTVSDAKTYFNTLTEAQKKELIERQIAFFSDIADALHKIGCYIGWSSNYQDEEFNQLLVLSGWDYSGSGYAVNEFEDGNLVNIDSDYGWSEFIHNVSDENEDGTLTISPNTTIYPAGDLANVFLGKVQMHIRFEGTLNFKVSGGVSVDLTSNGKRFIRISSATYKTIPKIWVKALTETTIYDIDFKASRC